MFDSQEMIDKCLSCQRTKCNDCLSKTGVKRYGYEYSVRDKQTGKLLFVGTADECASFLGVAGSTFRSQFHRYGGAKKYVYTRRQG